MSDYAFYAAWAFLAGAGVPLMAMLNGGLSRATGSPLFATLTLFLVAFGASGVLALVDRTHLPSPADLTPVPKQLFLGGLIVAFYVLSVTTLAPRFGVANTVMFVVTAQVAASTAIDAWGLFGAPVRSVSATHAIGLVVLVVGLVMTQAGGHGAGASGTR